MHLAALPFTPVRDRTMHRYRTHTCGPLPERHIGEAVGLVDECSMGLILG